MKIEKTVLQVIKEIWISIGFRRRNQFVALLFLMILVSFLEMVSIGAILPFLTLLSSPDYFDNNLILAELSFFEGNYLLLFSLLFGGATLLVSSMRLLLMWATLKLSFTVGGELSYEMYRKTLYQPYLIHISRNSSEILDAIIRKSGDLISCINHSVSIISAVMTAAFILGALIYVNYHVALIVFFGFGFLYYVVVYITRSKLHRNSVKVSSTSNQVIKAIQEGLGGIRDIIIDGNQKVYCKTFRLADLQLRKAQRVNNFIAGSPRYIVEGMGIILVLILAYFLVDTVGFQKALPVLGAFTFGAQRLLPVMQQAYNSWISIKGNHHSLIDGLDMLQQPDYFLQESASSAPIVFQDSITLTNVSFRYPESENWILKNINLDIPKGARIGVVGKSGAGKSTLLDIIMGLLPPSEGALKVDDVLVDSRNIRSWQKNIAHVPQNIYLADATILENIAFGVPGDSVNFSKVVEVAKLAGIHATIDKFVSGYETIVGERGGKLSGGQRQRIGIARALYKEAKVIILDEATSSLDFETELSIVESIHSFDKSITIVMVSHRVSTLKKCGSFIAVREDGVYQLSSLNQFHLES